MSGEAFISDEYDKVHDNDELKRNNKEYKPLASKQRKRFMTY